MEDDTVALDPQLLVMLHTFLEEANDIPSGQRLPRRAGWLGGGEEADEEPCESTIHGTPSGPRKEISFGQSTRLPGTGQPKPPSRRCGTLPGRFPPASVQTHDRRPWGNEGAVPIGTALVGRHTSGPQCGGHDFPWSGPPSHPGAGSDGAGACAEPYAARPGSPRSPDSFCS